MASPRQHDDDDWQAFAYLAGDMSPQERGAFEGRLADEQPAREALARAVRLVAALSPESAPAPCPGQFPPGGPRRLAAGWLSAAAVLVLCGVAGLLTRPAGEDAADLESMQQMLSLWNDTAPPFRPSVDWGDDDSRLFADVAEVTVPGWLLAALESSNTKPSEE